VFQTEGDGRWWLCVLRMPAQPSAGRVAAWRELRKAGAVQVGQGCWAVPVAPVFEPMLDRVRALADQHGGEFTLFDAAPGDDPSRQGLEAAWAQARADDWREFTADGGKYLDELAKETANEKFTLAELEEEEQSMDRLRRWHRDLRLREVTPSPSANDANELLATCETALEAYTTKVYRALGAT
jgi:hypothetical protein